MNVPTRRLIHAVAIGALLLVPQTRPVHAADPTPAPSATPPAGSVLTAQPSVIGTSVKPGGTSTTAVTVHAGIPLDITMFPLGLGQTLDGGFLPLPTPDDSSPYSGVAWVSADPATFHLDANQARVVNVTVHVPAGAGSGSRYAILEAQGKPPADGGNVAIGINLGLSVVIGIQGATATRTGQLSELAITPPQVGAPITVTALLQNTGNTHYGMPPYPVAAKASLQGPDGAVLATGTAQVSGPSIIPTFKRQLSLNLPTLAKLPDGRYHLELEADLPGGQILSQAALDFTVNAGVVGGATQAPASGPQTPGGQATDTGAVVLAALFGGGLMALVLLLLFAGRRRLRGAAADGSPKSGSGTPGAPGAG